ncbi:delta-sarcoglycan-like [Epargyreus clarus]|uniref:delta-sarcoglycan-like n=1 Tax=Epargyreus clarus TaxID=520877 RepID=UPI003C2F57B1
MGKEATASGIRGWGCTPTGDPPPAAVSSDERANTNSGCLPPVLTRGWRRTTLYGILVFLLLLVCLNIALTLWIISALRLTMAGIGPIKIVKEGIQLEGQAWIVDNLIASTIMSQIARPITLHSYRNFTVLVSEPGRKDYSKMLIKRDSIECSGRAFQIHDSRGNDVFHASREEVRIFSESLAVDGAGGVVVKSALQSPVVRAPPGCDLQLESLTRRLDIRAPQSIQLESRAGGIDITSHNNIKLDSIVGAIKIDAPNIIISNLKEAPVVENQQKNPRARKVYQLCACASGKLFLAAPDTICAVQDNDTELCR